MHLVQHAKEMSAALLIAMWDLVDFIETAADMCVQTADYLRTLAAAEETGTMPGEEMVVAGETDTMPGEEMAVAGEAGTMSGEEMAVAGETATMPGEEMAVAGTADVMPGKVAALAKELQAVELTGTWKLTVSLDSLETSRHS